MPSGFNSSQAGAIVSPSSGFSARKAKAGVMPKQPNFKARAKRPGGFAAGGSLIGRSFTGGDGMASQTMAPPTMIDLVRQRAAMMGMPPAPMQQGPAPTFLGPDGSANGATGAAGAGSVGAAVGEGASVSGGDAGTVGAGVGGNAGTASGAGDDGSGTWARGGRTAFRRGGRLRKPGYFFGGTPAQTTQQAGSNFNQSTSFDPQYTDYFHDVLGRSEGLYDQFKGKTAEDAIAGFTPDQLAAQQGVRANQGAWQPYMGAAKSGFDAAQAAAGGVGSAGSGAFGAAMSGPTALGTANPYAQSASGTFDQNMSSYMSPYLESAQKNMREGLTQNLMENVLPGVNDTFSGGAAGQFGRERHADITGRAIRDTQNTIAGKQADMFNQAYGTAGQLFQGDQNRLAGLAGTMGGLAQGQMSGFGNLGSQMTSAAAQGVQSQVAAGQAQQGLGKDVQAAGYTDLNALNMSGAQQQQLEQQKKTFGMQYPWQVLQSMQGLGQGWNVGSTTQGSTQSQSMGTQQGAQASPAAQIAGAATGVLGLGMPGGGTLGGNLLGAAFTPTGGGGGGGAAPAGQRGGYFDGDFKKEYGAGGYAPVVSGVRAMNRKRLPAIKQRLMQQQNGLQAPAQTGFARGGDVAQDKRMVKRAVRQHESNQHKGQGHTRLKLAGGGSSGYFRFLGDEQAPLEPMTDNDRKRERAAQRSQRGYWGRTKDDLGEVSDLAQMIIQNAPELAEEGARSVWQGAKALPGKVVDAFADAGGRYARDPLGTLWDAVPKAETLRSLYPYEMYKRMVEGTRNAVNSVEGDQGSALSTLGALAGTAMEPFQYVPQGRAARALGFR